MRKVIIIDDDKRFLDFFTRHVRETFPLLDVASYSDPVKSLAAIGPDIDLLLIDLEMPGIDGAKLLNFACTKGIDRGKIIILSGRDAEYLHQIIPMGQCLAVLNKSEARQKEVLDMVFKALERKQVQRAEKGR